MMSYFWPCLALVKIAFIAFALAEDPPPFDGDSPRPKPGQRSLVIVFDTTLSMSSELDQMRREAKVIVEHAAALAENPYYNFIFVDFNDPEVGTAFVTSDKNKLLNKLQKITTGSRSNYDCPELSMEGIRRALENALYKSQIFVFTDDDAKDYMLEETVNSLITEKQVTITFFITEGCEENPNGYDIYRRLAHRSGGQYFDIKQEDISEVMRVARESLNIHRDVVYAENFESEKKETFVVGDNTSDITVSVTGVEPRVDFTDPDNQKVDVKPKIDLKNVLVYQIDNPQPGPWVIDAKVVNNGRMQMTQVSPLTFEFGFSKFLPKTIKETFFRPLKGTENYLVVAPLNMPEDNTFTHVTITTDGATSRHDLREFSPGLFVTDAFLQPDLFKVTIHGKDAKGNEISRLISTYIQPEKESKPSVSIIQPQLDVYQYGEILLKCTAKSFSEMTVKWMKAGNVLKEIKADQSFELDHIIPMASLDDNGEYICEASNSMGKIESKISVTVKPQSQPLPKVTVYPDAKQISQKDTLRIKCIIKYPYDSIYWTFKQMSIESGKDYSETTMNADYVIADHTLVIPLVAKNNAGTYTCVAKAQNTEVKDSVDIAVKYESIITDSAEEQLVASTGGSTKLTCHGHGEPKPEIKWYFTEHGNKRQKLTHSTDTVTIANVSFTHDGIYECEVFNGVGKMQKRIIDLKVEALLPPILINQNDALIVAETGAKKTLVCECKQCLPLRSHTWTFNDVPIENTNLANVQVEAPKSNNDHFKTTLTIDHVGHANQGVYKCELKNDLGSVSSHKTVLNILTKPKIQQIFVSNSKIGDAGESIVQENQSLTLDCQQSVDLLPTFHWFKDEVRISSERYLKLGGATYDDSGVYRCEISNSKGSDTKPITVQVHGNPRIVSEFPEKVVKLTGVELEVECKATGFPQPKVHWENDDGHVVTTTNGVLKLLDYVEHYSTSYKCYAQNSVGSASRSTAMEYQQDLVFPNKVVQLLCPLRAIDKVEWYKDNELIGTSSPQFIIFGVIMEFTMPNAYNYSGIYRCETDRKGFNFNVTMTVPPTIETLKVTVDGRETPLENDRITVRLGQAVIVQCLVNGHPPPKVYWRTQRRHLGDGSSLHLSSIAKKHAGDYNCFAKLGAVGKAKMKINITVLS